ncbi:MAG TPA: diguanylate cyclase [Desulfomonilaceae bacterium]|nr:diguanylate cyclase [Desulfomonilaceae bacterium]
MSWYVRDQSAYETGFHMVTFYSPTDEASHVNILVVDDDPMVREVVVESIREAGYDVDVCGDGQEALARNAAKGYDLIVTDMRLPGLDGLSLIKKLKSSKSTTDVLVITGYGSIENAVECMKAGALEYLIKPFTVDQMQMAVRKAIEHRELRRRAQEREFYRELSYVDGLTGIHNRRFFDEALGVEIAKASRHGTSLVLLMIDIDDFKLYNDLNGHQKGDEALTKIAQLFKSACRGYDIVTRYGGEEFAILFPGATEQNAMELSRRIMHEVQNTPFEGEDRLPLRCLTVSVGVACYPRDAESSEQLIRSADSALYAAKRAGKNNIQLVCR